MQQELLFFCRTFLAGVLLAAAYDILRIFRNVISHNDLFVSLEDLLYWCVAGVFLFSVIYLENDGIIRVYALAGICLGALIYHWGLSGFLVKYLSAFLSKIKCLLKIPLKPLYYLRKKVEFWLSGVKISLSKQSRYEKSGRIRMRRKKKKSLQNKIAMVSVTFVVGVLFIGLMAESSRLEGKVAQYETKKSEVSAKIKDEEARTKEIDELKKVHADR